MIKYSPIAAVAAISMLCASSAYAQPAMMMPRTISVVGVAEGKVDPDKAVVNVQVYTESADLNEAKSSQDKKIRQLVSIAEKLGVKEDDIRTQYANVQPQFDYDRQSGKRSFRAYALNNNIEVVLRKLDSVGPLMDKLIASGFDKVQNVQFMLENQRIHEEKLLNEALGNAKAKAASMASALGGSIGKPISISESGAVTPQPPMPMPRMAMASMAKAESDSMSSYTPSGVIEITQTVNVTFELE